LNSGSGGEEEICGLLVDQGRIKVMPGGCRAMQQNEGVNEEIMAVDVECSVR
jgi:hypothetical protein